MGLSRENLRIVRSDSVTLRITVYDENNERQDLTGGTVRFRVKTSVKAPDIEIEKDSGTPSEVQILPQGADATKGQADIFIDPADSTDLEPGPHVYDVWVLDIPNNGDENVVIAPSEFYIERGCD